MNTKLKPIPELDDLPAAKREQLHAWIETTSYHKAIAKLKAEWGLAITYNKIRRYYLRQLDKRDMELALENETSTQNYLAFLNGEPVPFDKAGIERIMMHAYHCIGESADSPTRLSHLLRILHYNQNRDWTNKRLEISDRLAKVREEELALKRAASPARNPNRNPAPPPNPSELPPPVFDLDAIEERANRHFGLRRTKEDTRRAEEQLIADLAAMEAGLDPCHRESQPTDSTTDTAPLEPPSPPPSLEERVNQYTLDRWDEAIRGRDASIVGRWAASNFVSTLQWCPCGNNLPCPDHGDFPRRFWEVSSDHCDYFYILRNKNLPYTSPHLLRAEREAQITAAPSSDPSSTSPLPSQNEK